MTIHSAQLAIIKQMSRKKPHSSASNYAADEQAGITQLSWQLSLSWVDRNHAAQQALITWHHELFRWLIIHWSRDWSCTDPMTVHTLITWLIMHWSSGHHALITWLSYTDYVTSCTDQVAIMHWSRDCACTDHINDYALITWLSCTDHLSAHALIT